MKNYFKEMTVKNIQFETQLNWAAVEVEFYQGKVLIESRLVLDTTGINYLLAKLNGKGLSIDVENDSDHIETEEEDIYILDFEKKGWDAVSISDFTPQFQVKQIRA